MKKKLFCAIAGMLLAGLAHANEIDWGAAAIAATAAHSAKSTIDRTVTDKKTGLMWMRCSLGQLSSGSSCNGRPTVFQKAADAPTDPYAGYSDWRLPSIDELKTLVYCSTGERDPVVPGQEGGACKGEYQRPTISTADFPDTGWGRYQSEPYAIYGSNSPGLGVNFYNGAVEKSEEGGGFYSGGLYIRLVRTDSISAAATDAVNTPPAVPHTPAPSKTSKPLAAKANALAVNADTCADLHNGRMVRVPVKGEPLPPRAMVLDAGKGQMTVRIAEGALAGLKQVRPCTDARQ